MVEQDEQNKLAGKVLCYDVSDLIITALYPDLNDSGIKIYTADEPDEGLALAATENIDIILIDYEPEKNSDIEFLDHIKKKYPTINRIALSEGFHRDDVIRLLLKGAITNYFEKPCGLETLLSSFFHILHARKTLRNQKLLKLLDSASILPTFPKTYNDFIAAIENDLSMKEIGKIIEKDVSITTRVLSIANSDFFRVGRIGSIERAGIYLGLDTVKNIVFTVSLSSLKRLTASQLKNLEKIIYHSVQVNHNFQRIFETKTGRKLSDQYATIGITHDIGKIIMLQYLPQRFDKIMQYQKENPDIGFYRSEVELGYEGQTHAEIGAHFLNLWNFPETSVYTALFHHSTDEFAEPYREILDIFTIVNEVAYTNTSG